MIGKPRAVFAGRLLTLAQRVGTAHMARNDRIEWERSTEAGR